MRYKQLLVEYRFQNEKSFEYWIYDRKWFSVYTILDKIIKLLKKERKYHGPAQWSKIDLTTDNMDKKDADQGTLVVINPSIENGLTQKLGHINDWLSDPDNDVINVPCDPEEIPGRRERANLQFRRAKSAKTFDELAQMADEYFEKKNKKIAANEDWNGIESIIEYPDGHRWIEIKSKKALQREGKLMNHCVGSYWERVNNGGYRVLSLRDHSNIPLVTLGLNKIQMLYKELPREAFKNPDKWLIDQIQGPGNTNVTKTYNNEIDNITRKLGIDYDESQ